MKNGASPLQPLVHAGVWERVFDALTADRDNQYLMLDSTIVRANQQAATGKGGRDQALGRSRGGLTTKIHMLADTLGRPLRCVITPGQARDIAAAPELLQSQKASAVIADKAYDSNDLRAYDRHTIHFTGFVHLVAAMIWLR